MLASLTVRMPDSTFSRSWAARVAACERPASDSPKHNPTPQTLERMLKPFGLRIDLSQIRQRGRGRAAWARSIRLVWHACDLGLPASGGRRDCGRCNAMEGSFRYLGPLVTARS